jgi:tRNA modification GTPase
MLTLDDTIAALATPPGVSGLAVVRLSGPDALAIADKCFVPAGKRSVRASTAASHTIQFGHIFRGGVRLDEVLLAVMRAPRSFTRQDVVEITCHGGLLPARMILEALLEAGARLAEPGEFTRRAFLLGRIDLAQAEAVADLIHARTELALRAANEQLAGKLSQRIRTLRDQMMQALAHVEAHIDFPDEDISPDTRDQLQARLETCASVMADLLLTAREGQILRQGIRAAIIGAPNAGKSSLLNCLLGKDRAIVSATPGTTRDTIEETANIRGFPFVFIDTAGLRQARDEVELEGIRRSRRSLDQAEVVLHVCDASLPPNPLDQTLAAECAGKPRILVHNKCDLPRKLPPATEGRVPLVEVSCLTGMGMETLKDTLRSLAWSGEIKAESLEVAINARHQDALRRARTSTVRTLEALKTGQSLDLVALDLRIAVNALGEIVGQTATEDLLDAIFSQFCIGK